MSGAQDDLTHPPSDAEQDYYEMLFGRGPGDGDLYGYPGQAEDDNCKEVV